MSTVDNYIATLLPEEQIELKRIQRIVIRVVPSAEQGLGYGMPAYLYRSKPVFSCLVNKKFLSIYPFSGKVIEKLRDQLTEFEKTTGSIHFSLKNTLCEDLVEELLLARMMEIDEKLR